MGLEISAPTLLADLKALLGEGPLFDPRTRRLLSLDIKGGAIFETDPETGRTRRIKAEAMTSALALRLKGGYVCARRDGFFRLALEEGRALYEAIADPEADLPGNRFNDGKADPAGGFWAGTMDDAEEKTSGRWHRLDASGGAALLDDGYHVTNGPAFDPARGRVYLTDSARQTVFLAETDGATIVRKRIFLQFGAGEGYPDGMDVDAEGALWIAFWDGGRIDRFSPEGARLASLAMPVPRPTSVTIVGDLLFATSAAIGLDAAARAKAPLSGGLFRARLSRALGAEPLWYRG